MESVFGKLSVFDFFNPVFSGFVFLLGFELNGIRVTSHYYSICFEYFSLEKTAAQFCFFVGMICFSYIIGSFIQETGYLIKEKIIYKNDDPKKKYLSNERILNNKERMKICVRKANNYFQNNSIDLGEKGFTDSQCFMFYSHCEYYIQSKGLNDKIEKMRGLRGVSANLATTFTLLPFISSILFFIDKYIYNFICIEVVDLFTLFLWITISFLLAVLFWLRMKKNDLYKIRMIIGLYEVISEE